MRENLVDSLSATDRTILDALQRDGRRTSAELGELVHMSHSPVWRRIKKFEEDGVISGYRAALDWRKLGYTTLAFVSIVIDRHDEKTAIRFTDAVRLIPEVVSCHGVSGPEDFMLIVITRDLEHYSQVLLQKLRDLPGVSGLRTSFSLMPLKENISFFIDLLQGGA